MLFFIVFYSCVFVFLAAFWFEKFGKCVLLYITSISLLLLVIILLICFVAGMGFCVTAVLFWVLVDVFHLTGFFYFCEIIYWVWMFYKTMGCIIFATTTMYKHTSKESAIILKN